MISTKDAFILHDALKAIGSGLDKSSWMPDSISDGPHENPKENWGDPPEDATECPRCSEVSLEYVGKLNGIDWARCFACNHEEAY